jgi:hypothetical protein
VWEEENWDLRKAEAVLEGYVVPRKVSSQGQVRIYNRRVSVGRSNAGRLTQVQYDSAAQMWVISGADDGRPLRCVPAVEVTRQRILALALGEQG